MCVLLLCLVCTLSAVLGDLNLDGGTDDITSTSGTVLIQGQDILALSTKRFASVQNIQACDIDGGSITADAWTQRGFNTVTSPAGLVTLSNNQSDAGGGYSSRHFSLPVGVYKISAECPAYRCRRTMLKLMRNSVHDEIFGAMQHSHEDHFTSVTVSLRGYIQVTDPLETYGIEQYFQLSNYFDNSGLRYNCGAGGVNYPSTYCMMMIQEA